MTAFNFPAGAVAEQEYTAPTGTIYVYDGEKWNVKKSNLAAVATSGSYSDLIDVPDNNQDFEFNVGADDSVLRKISNGESVRFVGSDGITTSTDEEGNVTIAGGIQEGQTYNINVIGDVHGVDSTKAFDATTGAFSGDLTGNVTGDVKGSVFGDDSSPILDAQNRHVTATVDGDVTGSVFADDSAQIVDAVNNKVTTNSITTNDAEIWFGNIMRTKVATATSSSTSAFDFHTFRASDFRAMKIIIQGTDTTDNTYYVSELLCFHNDTDSFSTEYAKIHTSSEPQFTTAAILNNGNFIIRITPASNNTIEYKIVMQTITT